MKGDGGAVGLTEDPAALRRWMVSGPEISRLVSQFEDGSCRRRNADDKHHDDSDSMQRDFLTKVKRLKDVIEDYGNPFLEESGDIYKLDSKDVVHTDTGKLSKLKELGNSQYTELRTRMQNNETFYEPIRKKQGCVI